MEKLQIWSPAGIPRIVTQPMQKVRSLFGWFSRPFSRRLNKVHPMPDIVWRNTGTSSEDSDEDDKRCSAGLVEAAMILLEETTLAGATKPAEQQPQQQSIGALAAKDWDAFVGKCTAVKPRAVASSRLLAMRKAVPSPSARMVFQSQVRPSLCKLGKFPLCMAAFAKYSSQSCCSATTFAFAPVALPDQKCLTCEVLLLN